MNDRIPAFNLKKQTDMVWLRNMDQAVQPHSSPLSIVTPELTPVGHDSTCCLQQFLFPHFLHHPGNRALIDIE